MSRRCACDIPGRGHAELCAQAYHIEAGTASDEPCRCFCHRAERCASTHIYYVAGGEKSVRCEGSIGHSGAHHAHGLAFEEPDVDAREMME